MYIALLTFHSLFRWMVLAAVVISVLSAGRGIRLNLPPSAYTRAAYKTAESFAGIQLMLGYALFIYSPVMGIFRVGAVLSWEDNIAQFFGAVHALLMTAAVTLISLGWMASDDAEGTLVHRLIVNYYGAGLILMLLSVPWPFYEWIARPLYRPL